MSRRLTIRRARARRGGGFTLLEVLVAAVILSVGLLGVAGLQLKGLRYSQGAYLRSQATLAVNDIVDRMRANRDGVAAGAYAAIDSAGPAPADPGCIASADGCTPAQLARHDIRDWLQLFDNVNGDSDYIPLLPSGQGTVSRDDADPTLYTVTVSWLENEQHGPATKQVTIPLRMF